MLWHFCTCRYHNRDTGLCTTDYVQNKHSYWNKLICLCNCTRDPAGSLMTVVLGRRQIPDHPCLHIRTLKGAALFVRISRYRSAKMLLVHANGMSLCMVVTWPGLLFVCCKLNSELFEIRVICSLFGFFDSLQLSFSASQYHVLRYLQQSVNMFIRNTFNINLKIVFQLRGFKFGLVFTCRGNSIA